MRMQQIVVTCPNCGRENTDNEAICIYCGELLDHTPGKTHNFGESDSGQNQPRWGSARFDLRTRLILRVVDSSQIIQVNAHKAGGIILGRLDPISGLAPEVDLAPYDAQDKGVSRQHARLDIRDDSLYITDLGSANFTFLNGLRLTSQQPRILRDSDEIRLGHLKLQVTFVDVVD
jgi:hypothetical protein